MIEDFGVFKNYFTSFSVVRGRTIGWDDFGSGLQTFVDVASLAA